MMIKTAIVASALAVAGTLPSSCNEDGLSKAARQDVVAQTAPPPAPYCDDDATGPMPKCLGALDAHWMSLPDDVQRLKFVDIYESFHKSSIDSAGARGGVTLSSNTPRNWKKVEALGDAHLVDMNRTPVPTVVAVLELLRGSGEGAGTTLKPDWLGFLVVYPDKYAGVDGDVIDNATDGTASFRIVRVSRRPPVNAQKGIVIGPAHNDVKPCKDSAGQLHPVKDYSYAMFLGCAEANISVETQMHQLGLTFGQADSALRVMQAGPDSLALAHLLERAEGNWRAAQANRAIGMVPDARLKLLTYSEAGVWFSCGLGCCYANTLLN